MWLFVIWQTNPMYMWFSYDPYTLAYAYEYVCIFIFICIHTISSYIRTQFKMQLSQNPNAIIQWIVGISLRKLFLLKIISFQNVWFYFSVFTHFHSKWMHMSAGHDVREMFKQLLKNIYKIFAMFHWNNFTLHINSINCSSSGSVWRLSLLMKIAKHNYCVDCILIDRHFFLKKCDVFLDYRKYSFFYF